MCSKVTSASLRRSSSGGVTDTVSLAQFIQADPVAWGALVLQKPPAVAGPLLPPLEGGQRFYELHGLQAHADDLAHEAHDVFGVVGAIGVGADSAVFVFRHLVLVNRPFEGAAVAQSVFKGFGGNAPRVSESLIFSERRSFASRILSSTR